MRRWVVGGWAWPRALLSCTNGDFAVSIVDFSLCGHACQYFSQNCCECYGYRVPCAICRVRR